MATVSQQPRYTFKDLQPLPSHGPPMVAGSVTEDTCLLCAVILARCQCIMMGCFHKKDCLFSSNKNKRMNQCLSSSSSKSMQYYFISIPASRTVLQHDQGQVGKLTTAKAAQNTSKRVAYSWRTEHKEEEPIRGAQSTTALHVIKSMALEHNNYRQVLQAGAQEGSICDKVGWHRAARQEQGRSRVGCASLPL
eukprot:scpid103834/ scgid9073/ 